MSARDAYAMGMSAPPDDPIRVALIEPEAADAAWITELARSADAPARIVDEIAAERPDLEGAGIILLGLQRLGEVEVEALTRIHAGFPRTPLVVLAGPDVAARSGEAVGLGAQHVAAKKELTPEKLSSLIRYYTAYARAKSIDCAATA